MTITPPPSTPRVWPIDDEVYAIDQQIADLQRTADQAQTSSAVAASEVAIAQKAIRDLSTAKAEILEKGRLWDRNAQLQRALAERKAVADQVRQAVGAGGNLTVGKSALEAELKPKVNLAPSATLGVVNDEVEKADKLWKDLDKAAEDQWRVAAINNLTAAETDYTAKAADAERAWDAIQNSARRLEEQLLVAQRQLEEAQRLTASAPDPKDKVPPPGKEVNRAAAVAGVAWKDFKDTYTALEVGSRKQAAADDDDGQKQLRKDWEDKVLAAKDSLAVLLIRRKELADAQQKYEQRQASRPGRTPKENSDVVDALLTKLNTP